MSDIESERKTLGWPHEELDRLRTENERLKGELAESNHWRERHCSDAKAYGEQSQKNWAELTALRAENERLRAEIEQQSIYTKHVEDALQHHNKLLAEANRMLTEVRFYQFPGYMEWNERRLACLSTINQALGDTPPTSTEK